MICEKCNKKEAVTHIRQNINGVQTEMHLCEDCAKEFNGLFENEYGKFFSNFGFGIDSMLGSMFGQDFLPDNLISDASPKCPLCGATLNSIRKTGNAGCSKCYEVFGKHFMPLIQRIHGKTTHNGRVPASAKGIIETKNKLNELEKNLKYAIEAQEFEKAAELRDEIKNLKEKM